MKEEIAAAVFFVARLVKRYGSLDNDSRERFAAALTSALFENYKNHWHPNAPTKGQAFRLVEPPTDAPPVPPVNFFNVPCRTRGLIPAVFQMSADEPRAPAGPGVAAGLRAERGALRGPGAAPGADGVGRSRRGVLQVWPVGEHARGLGWALTPLSFSAVQVRGTQHSVLRLSGGQLPAQRRGVFPPHSRRRGAR